jgi:TRAP-type C4-dicarboxylate transport system permease small subunit
VAKRRIECFGAMLLAVMFAVTLFQVFARVVLGISSVWSEELARFLYVCLVFIGAAPLIRDDEHIRVGVLTDRLTGRALTVVRLVTILLTFPFIAVMTWGAWTNTVVNWRTYAPTLDWLSIGYVYLVIFLAGLVMLWYLAVNLARNLRALLRTADAARKSAR